jgi:hypothetical protein
VLVTTDPLPLPTVRPEIVASPEMVGVVIVGLVNVLLVNVCVSVVPTTAPVVLLTAPEGRVIPFVPSIIILITVGLFGS